MSMPLPPRALFPKRPTRDPSVGQRQAEGGGEVTRFEGRAALPELPAEPADACPEVRARRSQPSGGVSRIADLTALRETGVIAGAISGRALYDGAIDLAEALALLRG